MDKNVDKIISNLFKSFDFKSMEIFKNKRFLILAGVILFLAVFGLAYSIVILTDRTAIEQVPTQPGTTGQVPSDSDNANLVEVLPQLQRSSEEVADGALTSLNPIMDPFAEPIKLTGVVIGGRGGTMAIIESSGTSFIVAVGDYVDDLWAVYQITRGSAVLRARNQEVVLYLDQPPVTRSLDPRPDEGGQEEGI